MLSAIRSRITYVNVVATLVLVFAMTGGALAAKKYLITSTKQISPSVLKSLQGKAGAAGAPGAAGAQGAQGPAGPAGSAGAKGDTGAAGKEGPQGKEGATGKQGATGAKGTTGFTETLPSGKTETGEWGTGPNTPESASNGRWSFDISFSIPLAQAPEVVFVPANKEKEPGCGGRGGGTFPPPSGVAYVPGIPQASPGKLCIYIDAAENAQVLEVRTPVYTEEGNWEEFVGASPTGGLIQVHCSKGEECVAEGSWAVTGAEE